MPYDLFISYSRRDDTKDRVTQLVDQICREFQQFTNRSLEVFFDRTEIHGMDDWRHRILQGLRESRLLLACLSPDYIKSPWCEWEFVEYLKHEVARGFVGEGVAPIYFVEVPGWDGSDLDKGCADWIRDLRHRQRFDLRPWFQEGEDALHNSAIKERLDDLNRQIQNRVSQIEVVERSLGNVGRSNRHFIGRIDELRRIREAVCLGQVGGLATVHGLGGMGKTALAIQYAHAFAKDYGGGRWQVRCEGRNDLRMVMASLSPALGVEFNDEEKLDSDLQFARILAELRKLTDSHEPHKCLLILDNVDRPLLLAPEQARNLPSAEWLHVLITTRLGEDEMHGHQADRKFVAVDEMPEDDAVAMIESYQSAGRFVGEEERQAAVEIVRLLGRFTLAVETAAVFLGQFASSVTCVGFLERLQSEGLAGLEGAAQESSAGVAHGEKRLPATLQPTLEWLTEPEKLALRFAALVPADYVALPWLRSLVAQDSPEIGVDASPGHPDPWLKLLSRLLNLRLLKPTDVRDTNETLLVARMHRLLQDVVNRDAGEAVGALEDRLIGYVKGRCEFLKAHWLEWNNRWEIEPLRAFSETLLAREHSDASWIANSISLRLFDLARHLDAEPLMRRALAIDEQSYGPNHPEVAPHLNNLAQLLQATNRLSEAEPLMRRALEIVEQSYGLTHPGVAMQLNNLAQLLKATNRLSEAEPLMRRALEIDEQSYGPSHPEVARDVNNLAQLLQATNRLSEAEPLMRRALEIDEQSYGPNHPEVATDLNNLAQLLQATNRLSEAEPLMRRALEVDEQSYDLTHPRVAIQLNNLAQLLKATNRLSEAEPLMRRALEIDEQSYGPNHPRVARDLNNLAQLFQATSRRSEAEPLMRRALEIDEQSYGSNHPSVAIRLNNLAGLLQATNRLSEAEPLMRRALEIDEQSYGPNHPRVAIHLNNLAAGLLQATNRLSEAEPLMRRALEIDAQSYGPNHPRVAGDLNNLAQLLQATNRLSEAEPLMRRVVEIFIRFTVATGHEHPHLQAAKDNYASLLELMGHSQEDVLAP